MKTNYLVASLYLAPALAAPLFHTSTVLVAGTSAKTVVIRPGHQATVEETKQVALKAAIPAQSKTSEAAATSILDAERPLTTEELMALSRIAHPGSSSATPAPHKAPANAHSAGGNKLKVSVGTLVVPGGAGARSGGSIVAQLLDPKVPHPYLVSGYYVPAKPADIWVVGMILSFVMVVVGLELWGPAKRSFNRLFQREGAIRLDDNAVVEERAMDVEDEEEESDDEDDMDAAPFGSYRPKRQARSLRLPGKVDEKAGWI